jgi:16S rRNA (uracil1498-N3)-methyltransferase
MEERYFKINSNSISQNKFSLSKSESSHFINSLRGKLNDKVWLLDGEGCAYKSIITSINKNLVSGVIKKRVLNYGESSYNIHLVVGLIKGSRMDFIIEKATELGVKSIQPIIFERCIKKKLNIDRSQRIVESAAKQSGRSYFPEIFPVSSLDAWISENHSNTNILYHMNGLNYLKNSLNKENYSYNIIIGPEGDFSEVELRKLEAIKPATVSLGSRRLRSETSAIVGLANINQMLKYIDG